MFKSQKYTWKNNFMQIVAGQTQVTTQKGAQQMFSESFKDFYDQLLLSYKADITDFLQSPVVLQQFSTHENYDEIESLYVKSPKLEEYKKQIDLMKDPVPGFERHVKGKRNSILDNKIEKQLFQEFKAAIRSNLTTMKNRV